MARPATKQLGLAGIMREVLAAPLRNPELTAAVFLLLLPCNFLLITFPQASPRLELGNLAPLLNRLLRPLQERSAREVAAHGGPPPPAAATQVPTFQHQLPLISIAPLGYVVDVLTTVAMVYLAAVACTGKHAATRILLSKVARSWKQVVVSSLYLQLLHLASACLSLVSAAVAAMFALAGWGGLLLVLLALFSMVCLPVVFTFYLNVVCRLCLVVSAVEEDKRGVAAMARAFALARRRKLLGVVLTALCFVLNWSTASRSHTTVMGGKKRRPELGAGLAAAAAGGFVDVLIGICGRLLGWLLWTAYYHECRKSYVSVGKSEDVGDEGRSLLLPMMPPSVNVDERMI